MRILTAVILAIVFCTGALAQRSIEFSAEPAAGDAIIAAVSEDGGLDGLEAVIGDTRTANLRRAMAAKGFKAEPGATASFLSGEQSHGEIHLIGLDPDMTRPRDWEDFGGTAAAIARDSKAERVAVIAPFAGATDAANAAFGAVLGQYAFDKYKSSAEPVSGVLVFVAPDAAAARAAFENERAHVAAAVNWVRDMQSEPANVIYPEEFVRRVRQQFRGVRNVSVTVLDERQMAQRGMGAILGVGRGSARPPRMMIVRYDGGATGDAPLVFAGKGITFDSGGISLKGNSGMWQMKADMTGAAVVMGATLGLAKSGAGVNIVAIAALAENMPGGRAQRPGDVVKSMSGKTIEILSTDAEGRLVLADAVWLAQKEYEPSLLVDVATLTGSVGRALGDEYAGLFARDDEIAIRLLDAGELSGDDLWRLPLHKNHSEQIKSFIADVKNSDTGPPGASTGAAFIGAFVLEETPWAHIDIAGIDWLDEPTPTRPKGASGFGVRLLDRLARDTVE